MRVRSGYANSAGLHIAYQVFGEGPFDLVVLPGFAWNLEYQWEEPRAARAWRRLASFARVIMLDKRGTGLSDRVPPDALPTLEERMDDLRAVMDAVGSERAALCGFWEGGPLAVLFAATYPDRTRALVLFATPVAFRADDDYPWTLSEEMNEKYLQVLPAIWGTGETMSTLAPSARRDPHTMDWFARMERLSASPGSVAALWRMNMAADVRGALATVHVPTLVMGRRGDQLVPIEVSRYIAARIPSAKLVELEGEDHLFFIGDLDSVMDPIEEFLTGASEHASVDRLLATVLFVDIVESTKLAARMGDKRWRRLLDDFLAAAEREVARFRGTYVASTGDGFLARFDGPARAVRSADAVRTMAGRLGLDVRAGLHTGECEVRGTDLGGIAVHIGARIAELAAPAEILVSSTVRDLVAGSSLVFRPRGEHRLKGVPEPWRLYALETNEGGDA